ncbi:YbeD family protein [Candidatus Methylocalor cossyra]|uniref:UPF0250 protein MECH1_V1_0414 n=1 Tax=Candidatus Methylocalor cossyra TaxID=3108543 RepID=A0ABM9NF09_9GAMM
MVDGKFETLLQFPCEFSIKAFGHSSRAFEGRIAALVRRHAPDLAADAVSSRPSKGGKYLVVTVTVRATSREQLDAIYRELSACSEVLMAL